MTIIYILKLKDNKYYVGKTNNIKERYEQHINGTGSFWTKKYKPLKLLKIFDKCSNFDEDKYVKEYMSKYGIDNVRGGSYVSEKLDNNTKYLLQKEIWAAKNLCTRCGRSSHFVKNCYAKTTIDGDEFLSDSDKEDEDDDDEVIYCCEYCDKEFKYEKTCEKHEKVCNKIINNKFTKIVSSSGVIHSNKPETINFSNTTLLQNGLKNYNGEFKLYTIKNLIELKNKLLLLQKELVLQIGDFKCIKLFYINNGNINGGNIKYCNSDCILCGNQYDLVYKFVTRYTEYENILKVIIHKLHHNKNEQIKILNDYSLLKIKKTDNILLLLEDLPEFVKDILLKNNTITLVCDEINKEIKNKSNFE